MKRIKSTRVKISMMLVIVLLVSVFTPIMYAEQDNSKAYKAVIEQKVQSVLEDGFSQYYKVNNFKVNYDELKIIDDTIKVDLFVTMNTTLKAKKVEELPYVKGMLKKVNLSDFSYESKAKTDEAVSKTNKGKLKNEQLAKVSKEIDFKFNDLKEYINKANDNNFFLTVTAKVSNGIISEDSIIIMAENVDTYIPVEELLPKTSVKMEEEGFNDMQLVIDSKEDGYSPSLYASYDRIAARDYANTWSTNPTSCYDDGTTCGIKQARNLWNNTANPYYVELCHNDCADFVSQGLYAGGIPMDSTWKRGTPANTTVAWVNTGYLKTYMLTTKSYWVASTYTSASAGGVLYTASSHVVMIVQNDTITRKYSAHTNDRNQVNYSNGTGYLYYILW